MHVGLEGRLELFPILLLQASPVGAFCNLCRPIFTCQQNGRLNWLILRISLLMWEGDRTSSDKSSKTLNKYEKYISVHSSPSDMANLSLLLFIYFE